MSRIKLLHIIDFKYGQGVLVDAEENPQMMLYALGALRLFDSPYDITEVNMSIYQPRRENVSTWTISVDDLNAWAENVLKPKAELAHKGEGDYLPGSWCQFCKAAVKCRARAEEKLQLARFEFAPPPLLSDEEIEDILAKLDDLTKWASEIQAYAQDAAILGSLVEKPRGRPTLVPDTDKRPALKKIGAGDDFTEFKEDQSMSTQKSNTKVVTGIVRLSYEHVWEPASINGSNPKYSVSLIIPKSDTKTIVAINAAVDAAIKDGVAKFGGKVPPKGALKLPLRDGDAERDDEAYKGAYFVNANSTTAPQIVDRAVQTILDRAEVYSGCHARVSINFYAFNTNGNKGIACGLGNIQKVRDGEPFSGRTSAADDFATDLDDDFLS